MICPQSVVHFVLGELKEDMLHKWTIYVKDKVNATDHSKISNEISKYCSIKLSLRGKDFKSEEKFLRKLDALILSSSSDSI